MKRTQSSEGVGLVGPTPERKGKGANPEFRVEGRMVSSWRNRRFHQPKRAFTLLEIIIVITIIITLAAVAVSQTSGVQQLLRFQNAFQQTVFLVQRSRTMAVTRQGTAEVFGIDLSASNEINLFSATSISDTDPTSEENFKLPSDIFHSVQRTASGGADCTAAKIGFERGTGNTLFSCTDLPPGVRELRITLCQVSSGASCASEGDPEFIRNRSFIIHLASGIPQF